MKRIKSVLKNLKHDALLVSSPISIFYLTEFNGFSNTEREAYILITKKENYIFTDSRYFEAILKHMPFLKLVKVTADNNFEKNLKDIVKKQNIKSIAINTIDLKLSEYTVIKKAAKVFDDELIIEKIREIKDEKEINNLKLASKLGDKVFEYILKEIKLNVTEIEIAKKIEIFILQNNATISFAPIVAFGKNSSSPHHVPTKKKLTKNNIVLLDFGTKVNGYCSDMTRTVFFGKATKKQKKIYEAVLSSQLKAIEYINSQIKNKLPVTNKEIDNIARDYIISQGFESIPHSLGHGIGLEVHELPRLSPTSKNTMQKNNVFSIEPGIYIPNFGGVRIEDLAIFTNKELVLISRSKKGIIEL